MIRVFTAPIGTGEYQKLYKRIQASKKWTILSVTQNTVTFNWNIRCCDAHYFDRLPEEKKYQLARWNQSMEPVSRSAEA